MGNELTDLFNTEVHFLTDIRLGLHEDMTTKMCFVTLMTAHHDFIRESDNVLTRMDASEQDKQYHCYRFFRLLEMHAKAEEEVLYKELRSCNSKDVRVASYAAMDEHDVVFQLEKELLEMGYRELWTEQIEAKAKTVAVLVKNHLKDEEIELFPMAKKLITPERMEELKSHYIAKCKTYLDDSQMTSTDHPLVRVRPTELWRGDEILTMSVH